MRAGLPAVHLSLVPPLSTEAERTGSPPSAQLTGLETVTMSGCRQSLSSQARAGQEPLDCVSASKEFKACRKQGGDGCRTAVTTGEIRETFTEEVTSGLGLISWTGFPFAEGVVKLEPDSSPSSAQNYPLASYLSKPQWPCLVNGGSDGGLFKK